MKLFKKFKVSSNGPSTEWVSYETLTLYTSFLIVETTPFFQCDLQAENTENADHLLKVLSPLNVFVHKLI